MGPEAALLSAVSIANMAVLAILLASFAKMYRQTRAQLPLGMIVVSAMLFLHNAIASTAYFSMDALFAHAVFPYMLSVGIAELAALVILLKISAE